jgi:phosphohistidine swiveling domain-containing protein
MYKSIQTFKDIVNNDPVFSVQGAISPLFLGLSWQSEPHPLHGLFINRKRETYIALNEKVYLSIAIDKFKDYFVGNLSIDNLRKEYDSFEKDVESLYDRFTDVDLENLSNDELLKFVMEIRRVFIEMCRISIYIENVDYEKILGVIGNQYKKDLDLIWEKATEAIFMSFENRRLKKIIDTISSNKKNLVRKVKYIFTDYYWPADEAVIVKRIEEIKTNFDKNKTEIDNLILLHKNKELEHANWLGTLNPASLKIADFANLVMHMRDLRKDPIAQIQSMLAEISVVMLKRAGVDVSFAPAVILYEYSKGVDYLMSIKEDIENRKNGCIYITYPDHTYLIEHCDYEDAVNQAKDVLENKHEQVSELVGQIACRGIVRGVVRVVLDPHIDKGFQEGDILVTSMTRPEFVPIMKRAGAVVTNEGGITCHAAIVSRELKIPCIIGTKIATKVLKDGDMVEVDADKGVVVILK